MSPAAYPPPPQSPPIGITLPASAGAITLTALDPRAGHSTPHLVHGVCVCPCRDCTGHSGTAKVTVCVCPECPTGRCGAKGGTE